MRQLRKRVSNRQEYQRRKLAKLSGERSAEQGPAASIGAPFGGDSAMIYQLLVRMSELEKRAAAMEDEIRVLKASASADPRTAARASLTPSEWLQQNACPAETYSEWSLRFSKSVGFKDLNCLLPPLNEPIQAAVSRKLERDETPFVPLMDMRALTRTGEPHLFGDDRKWRAISPKEFANIVDDIVGAFTGGLRRWSNENYSGIMELDSAFYCMHQVLTGKIYATVLDNVLKKIEIVFRRWLLSRSRAQLKAVVAANAVKASKAAATMDTELAQAAAAAAEEDKEQEGEGGDEEEEEECK